MLYLRKGVALWLIAVAGASSHAQGQSIEELKKAGDLRGLVAKLGDRRAAVRSEAAVALPGVVESKDLHFRSYSAVMLSMVVRKIKDRDTLKSLLDRITPAATKDPDAGVRDYSGRAMHHIQHVLQEKEKADAPVKR